MSYLLWCSYIHTPRLQSTDLTEELDNHHLRRNQRFLVDAAAAVLLVLVGVGDDDGSDSVHDDDSEVSVFSPWLEAEDAGSPSCYLADARNTESDVEQTAALTETWTCCGWGSRRSGDLKF